MPHESNSEYGRKAIAGETDPTCVYDEHYGHYEPSVKDTTKDMPVNQIPAPFTITGGK